MDYHEKSENAESALQLTVDDSWSKTRSLTVAVVETNFEHAVKPSEYKNLVFKNPLGQPLQYKNLFSLKFDTNYNLYKKKNLYAWANKSTFRILFGDIGTLSLQLQCNGMQILHNAYM